MSLIEDWVFANKGTVSVLLVGLLILGFGLFLLRAGVFEGTKVEIIQESAGGEEARLDSTSSARRVVVEVAGSVQNPGVYELLASERVERLLIEAGGLSAEADRDWINKNLNRAAKLVDGQKIYIPSKDEIGSGKWEAGSKIAGAQSGKVNLNTASASELDSLWGVGPARAQAIIENRPYSSIEELLSKKAIPTNVYEKIKDKIIAP